MHLLHYQEIHTLPEDARPHQATAMHRQTFSELLNKKHVAVIFVIRFTLVFVALLLVLWVNVDVEVVGISVAVIVDDISMLVESGYSGRYSSVLHASPQCGTRKKHTAAI